jgi:hypothetical protein
MTEMKRKKESKKIGNIPPISSGGFEPPLSEY